MAELMIADLDPYARRFRVPQWTSYPRVTDVPRLFADLPEFQGWTAEDHVRMSLAYLAAAVALDRQWQTTITVARRTYGDHGSLIGGVYRDHFPEDLKAQLRIWAYSASEYRDRSRAHWQAAGRQVRTWRTVAAAVERGEG